MQAKPAGPLERYNSLTDENLAGFFGSPEKRKYLQRMGLITRDGQILDEESIRRHHLHEEHKIRSKHLMTEALVKKAVELERKRRGELKKKMDQLSKFEMAEKIKYQSCNPMGVAHLNPTHTHPPQLSGTLFKRQEQLQLSQKQFEELNHMVHHVTASKSLPNYYISPYLRPRLPSAPRPKNTTNMRIRTSRIKRPQTAPSGTGISLPINDKIHTNVCMRFCYLGSGVNVRSPYHAKVKVDQQHCGGNTICLFEGHLQPNDEFTIFSRRHYGMPLGLSMYIDGMINCRLSSCCEYKHYPGQMVGGKSAHFRLLQVNGGKPCYLCELRSKRSSKPSKSKELHSDLLTPDVLHKDITNPLDKDQQGHILDKDQQGHPLHEDQQGHPLDRDWQEHPLHEDQQGHPLDNDQQGHPLHEDQQEHPLDIDQQGHPLHEDQQGHPLDIDQQGHPLHEDQQGHPLKQSLVQVEEYQDDFEDDDFEDENENTYASDFESQSHTASSVETTPLHNQGDCSVLSSNTHQPSKTTPTKNDTSALEYHNESPETHLTSESESEIQSNKEKTRSATSESEHLLENNPETQSSPCRHSEIQSPEHESGHSETQVISLENNTTANLEDPATEEYPETQSIPDKHAKTQPQSEHSQTQSEHSILNLEATEKHPETQSTHADNQSLEHQSENPEISTSPEHSAPNVEGSKENTENQSTSDEHADIRSENPETSTSHEHLALNVQTSKEHPETQSTSDEHGDIQSENPETSTSPEHSALNVETSKEHPETQSTSDEHADVRSENPETSTSPEHSALNVETSKEHPETQSTSDEHADIQSENPETSTSHEHLALNVETSKEHPETQSTSDEHADIQSENPETSTSPEHSALNVETSKEHPETQSTSDEHADIQPPSEEPSISNNELFHIASSLVHTALTGAMKRVHNNNDIENEPSNSSLLESDSEIREYLQTILDRAKSYVQNLVTNKEEDSSYKAGQVESEVSLSQHHPSTSSSSMNLDNYGADNGRKSRLEERQYIETSSQDEEQHESEFIVRNGSESPDHKYFSNSPSSSRIGSSLTNRTYSA